MISFIVFLMYAAGVVEQYEASIVVKGRVASALDSLIWPMAIGVAIFRTCRKLVWFEDWG